MKNCPLCGTDAEANAAVCTCGYKFSGSSDVTVEASPNTQSDVVELGGGGMVGWGIAMFVVGIALMGYAGFVYDPSVETSDGSLYGLPQRINNTGLLQRQLMLFLFGAFTMLSGAVLWVGGAIRRSMRYST